MAVVKEIKSGGARIIVHDDYCKDKTEKEIEDILKECGRIAYYSLIKTKEKTA